MFRYPTLSVKYPISFEPLELTESLHSHDTMLVQVCPMRLESKCLGILLFQSSILSLSTVSSQPSVFTLTIQCWSKYVIRLESKCLGILLFQLNILSLSTVRVNGVSSLSCYNVSILPLIQLPISLYLYPVLYCGVVYVLYMYNTVPILQYISEVSVTRCDNES